MAFNQFHSSPGCRSLGGLSFSIFYPSCSLDTPFSSFSSFVCPLKPQDASPILIGYKPSLADTSSSQAPSGQSCQAWDRGNVMQGTHQDFLVLFIFAQSFRYIAGMAKGPSLVTGEAMNAQRVRLHGL